MFWVIHLPSTASKEILCVIVTGGIWFSEIPQERVPRRRGAGESQSCNVVLQAGELQAAEPESRQDCAAGERGLALRRWECCQMVSDQSQKGNIAASCYITPPRLQLVLGYFLSQIAYPRKAATAAFSLWQEQEAAWTDRDPLLYEHIVTSQSWLAFT